GPDQPVFGLRAAWAGRPNPPTAVPDMAALYLAALRTRQPHGPYRIVAFCLGGMIAFEMARQLRRAGEEVALLALADSQSPTPGLALPLQANLAYALRHVASGGIGHVVRRLGEKLSRRRPAPAVAQAPERHRIFMGVLRAALASYRPAACPLPAVLGISNEAGGEDWARIY